MSFKEGDVVQLKSGGPQMTVSETNGVGVVLCIWFDSQNKLQEKAFNQSQLAIYQKPKVPRPHFGGL